MLGLDALVNVANVVYLFSYSVRDILYLRILTVFGAGLLLPYYYLQIEPLYAPMAWNVVFISINIYWIIRLILERRPVQFSDEERRLYELALRNMSERDAFKLFRLGRWTSAQAGTCPLTQGAPVEALSLISRGRVAVEMNGKLVDTIGEGCFLGAHAFLSGEKDFKAPVTVRAIEPIRIFVWPQAELKAQFAKNPHLQIDLEASLGLEIAHYLQTARDQLLERHMT